MSDLQSYRSNSGSETDSGDETSSVDSFTSLCLDYCEIFHDRPSGTERKHSGILTEAERYLEELEANDMGSIDNSIEYSFMWNREHMQFRQDTDTVLLTYKCLIFDNPSFVSSYILKFLDIVIEKQDIYASKCPDTLHSKAFELLMLSKIENVMGNEWKYVKLLEVIFYNTLNNDTEPKIIGQICTILKKDPIFTNVYQTLIPLIKRLEHVCKKIKLPNSKDFIDVIMENPDLPDLTDEITAGICDDHLIMVLTTHKRLKLKNIVVQKMDRTVYKWLYYLNLCKYRWFFNSLNYLEILMIDQLNIKSLISKANRLCQSSNFIKEGVQERICTAALNLRSRSIKFRDLLENLNSDVLKEPSELLKYLTYMHDILHYPIPNKYCVENQHLQHDLCSILSKILDQIMLILNKGPGVVRHKIVGDIITKYSRCTILIVYNEFYMDKYVAQMMSNNDKLNLKLNSIFKNVR